MADFIPIVELYPILAEAGYFDRISEPLGPDFGAVVMDISQPGQGRSFLKTLAQNPMFPARFQRRLETRLRKTRRGILPAPIPVLEVVPVPSHWIYSFSENFGSTFKPFFDEVRSKGSLGNPILVVAVDDGVPGFIHNQPGEGKAEEDLEALLESFETSPNVGLVFHGSR